jgi:diadenosine tetraphosphate (Ap4A) HIT family hydrolase
MSLTLLACGGGHVALPARDLVLVDRRDGGNLIVNPPREVWERSELTPDELTRWSFLVAATGRAMLDTLPQLALGCINYWEAGNWALNDDAPPAGRKSGPAHRRVHLHLLGRSRDAAHPDWRWGEAPRFPDFARRHEWAKGFRRLEPAECEAVVVRAEALLRDVYGLDPAGILPRTACTRCGYTTPRRPGDPDSLCTDCSAS